VTTNTDYIEMVWWRWIVLVALAVGIVAAGWLFVALFMGFAP